ncbi:MAG: methionyl-tRNA formyltransferase [Bacillota bacterium]|nr:methionyl-tRNA formyltransferase [Bacillota bacterium]
MRIIYMGTPDFAVPSLEEIHKAGHEVVYVVTQPDAVRDRGKKVKFSPVKEKAIELDIPVLQPLKVRGDEEFIETLRAAQPDVIAVAAYGQILPKEVLDIPRLGCINVHGSLLPRFRGAAPIQRSIIAGDEETGITIMYMEEGLDTGDMLAKRSTPIGMKTGQQLHDELAVMGAELLVETLPKLEEITGEKQDDALSTYAPMLSKKEGHVDFSKTPEEIERVIRAFDPWPGTYFYYGDKMVKLHAGATLKSGEYDEEVLKGASAGTVLAADVNGLDIACNGGVLRVTEIQMPGKRRVEIKEYLKGNSIEIGTVLG